jgi:hypothetical protein
MAFSLDERMWLSGEHLGYEDKRAYGAGLTRGDDRAIVEKHLSSCAECREEVAAFLEDRRENDRMLSIRYKPDAVDSQIPDSRIPKDVSWRLGGLWSPLRAAALILIVASIGILVARIEARRHFLEFFRPGSETRASSIKAGKVGAANALTGHVPAVSGRGQSESGGTELAAASEESRVTLSDHGHKVVVEPRITGLSGANDAQLETITAALVAEDIPLPAIIANLWGSEGALRGERVNPFDLLRPRREVVRETRPSFRWATLKDASSYQVFVVDSKRAAVFSSGRLSPDVTSWKSVAPLVRGEAYSWTVSATVRGEEVISPGPAEAEWKFCVLADAEHQRLRRIEERTDSHLARGVLYARSGLISESERELQKLLDENQNSTAVRKLLARVKSWR